MRTLRLVLLSLKYHWDSQKSNPANLFAAVFGMVINNLIVLWGLWAMLFDGKPNAQAMTIYFLALNAMITLAWGSVCFVLGGLHSLGEFVEEGTLEPMLATPRKPLLLVGISNSIMPALGDVLQGFCNLFALAFIATPGIVARCLAFAFVSATACVGLFILIGSVPFFVNRGNTLSVLLRECCLSLSFYPMGKVLSSPGRYLLFLTPAAAVAVLPMDAIETGSWDTIALAIFAATALLWLAIRIFELGLKRYQSASYVTVRS